MARKTPMTEAARALFWWAHLKAVELRGQQGDTGRADVPLRELAPAWGISHPYFARIVDGVDEADVTAKLAPTLARLYFDGSLDRLYQAANEAYRRKPSAERASTESLPGDGVRRVPVDPKRRVQESTLYRDMPREVRWAFDHDDRYTRSADAGRITEEVLVRRLLQLADEHRAGLLPAVDELPPGVDLLPPVEGPDYAATPKPTTTTRPASSGKVQARPAESSAKPSARARRTKPSRG